MYVPCGKSSSAVSKSALRPSGHPYKGAGVKQDNGSKVIGDCGKPQSTAGRDVGLAGCFFHRRHNRWPRETHQLWANQRDPWTCHACVFLHSYWTSLEIYSIIIFLYKKGHSRMSQLLEIESSRDLVPVLLTSFNIKKKTKKKMQSVCVMWSPMLVSDHWIVFQWPLAWEEGFFQQKKLNNKQTNKQTTSHISWVKSWW